MPAWGWVVLGVLTALLALPWLLAFYARWWTLAMGPGAFLAFWLPRALILEDGMVWTRRCPICKTDLTKQRPEDRWLCDRCGWVGGQGDYLGY